METFDLAALLCDMESDEATNFGLPVIEAPPWFSVALVLVYVRPN
jgi:hypothetical protein